jgi:TolB-like protein
MKKICFFIPFFLLMAGCAASSFVKADPDVDRSDVRINAPLIIIIDKQIRDSFMVPGAAKNLSISNYRKSLQHALKVTFEPNFQGIEFRDEIPGTGIYLQVRSARPIQEQFPSSISLNVQYRIALGSDGEERVKIEKLSKGNFQAATVFQMQQLLKKSMESMCEDMYLEIFTKKENLAVFTLKGKQYEMATKHGKQRIAVMNFRINSGITKEEAQYITDTIRTGLIKTDMFDVITNDKIDEMLKMEGMRQALGTECESKDCQINLGRALECKYVVVGSIQHVFKEYSISVKILNVSDQRYLHAEEITVGEKNKLPDAARKVVELIVGKRI